MFEKLSKAIIKIFGSRNKQFVRGESVGIQPVGTLKEFIKKLDKGLILQEKNKIDTIKRRLSRNWHLLKKAYAPPVWRASGFEEKIKRLDDETLKRKTTEFRVALGTCREAKNIKPIITRHVGCISPLLKATVEREVLEQAVNEIRNGQKVNSLEEIIKEEAVSIPIDFKLDEVLAILATAGQDLVGETEATRIYSTVEASATKAAEYIEAKDINATIMYYAKEIAHGVLTFLPKKAVAEIGRNLPAYLRAKKKVGSIIRHYILGGEHIDTIVASHAEEIRRALTRQEINALIMFYCKKPKDLLPEAFAVVREAARRNVGMRHFDVQLVGGNILYEGKIAEMATGEGKTLVATLAAYLVHLTGRHVHIVTVNDYLAKRDAEWMGPIYLALGLTVGAIQADMDTAGEERKNQYACDITYGTNNEFGFDYLRDNMKLSLEHMVQGELQYGIVDEVDSILIDEARTPLIISGPAFDDVSRYKKADDVAGKLTALQGGYDRIKKQIDSAEKALANAHGELSEAKKARDNNRIEKAQATIEKLEAELGESQGKLGGAVQYYEVEYDRKAVHLTHEGITAAQEAAGVGSFFTGSNMEWPHLLEQALRAYIVFEKERDYVVMDGKVVIVDEFTGRLMHGRQWSDGLHQAVEAKEAVQVKEETQTLATITLQNFFKLYGQIAGMTGTAATEAEEFMKIYKLDVVVIPTNAPCIRADWDDVIYKTMPEKFNAILEEINEISGSGRPVLVGTVSVENNEALSKALDGRFGLEHEVLNAKYHEREAQIVAKAGQQHQGRDGKMHGNITIATNMAGRGTDIKLGPGVLWEVVKEEDDSSDKRVTVYTLRQRDSGNEITFKSTDPLAHVFQITRGPKWVGGLHVLGTERHEARRIDNQLRGRCGRQGDPGSSQFFLSFDDELMRVFAPEWTVKALSWIGWQEGEPIYHKRISKGIEKAQKKVEERNFEIRKSLLEYDEVMDYQRKIFYSRRRKILAGKGLKEIIGEMIEGAIAKSCQTILDPHYSVKCVVEWAVSNFGVELKTSEVTGLSADEIEQLIKDRAGSSVGNDISLSLGEYLEDYEDKTTWDVAGLCKWAMSGFRVSLSPNKIKDLAPEQIEEQLITAAREQVEKKDCTVVAEFLKPDFTLRRLVEWARAKFDIKLDINELAGIKPQQILSLVGERTKAKYKRREIEYPIEFAMNMVYGPQGPNVYGFEALADWANKKYNAKFSVDGLQQLKPRDLHKQLLEMSETYSNGRLIEEIDDTIGRLDTQAIAQWASQRFGTTITAEQLSDGERRREIILQAGREFLRKELSELEKYVLLQVYDGAWKDHLYNMDHLKDSIWMRSFAEKDPRTEYKREGHRMFSEMLTNIEERVTDIVFKVHLEAGARARSVWRVSQTAHDEVGQFAMAERQRAAAQAPQGEVQVKQIRLDKPKVGRNDPCPCGSGKKYKKCCGKNL